jgi:hypothetical protein
MRQWLRSRLTYANVMATVAVFFALGGTAVATHETILSSDIVDNQVFSADVRNDTLAGGGLAAADLRPNSVGASEVAADSLGEGDLAPDSVGSSEVIDGGLHEWDIGEEGAPFNFTWAVGFVPAHDCVYRRLQIFALENKHADHFLLTPNYQTTSFDLEYSIQYTPQNDDVGYPYLVACNPTDGAKNDGNTTFNLLVINGQ